MQQSQIVWLTTERIATLTFSAAETGQVDLVYPRRPNPQQFHLLFLLLQPQVNASSNLFSYRRPSRCKPRKAFN
jgi:hypothetical protein